MTENVSLPPQQPSPRGRWKHGLRLQTCECCINEHIIAYKCSVCYDFGEYWLTPKGNKIPMGYLSDVLKRIKTTTGLDNDEVQW